MHISLIVAMSDGGVIGRDGELPWRLSADLQRFKRLTMGHHILMGRKTFESIGRPLPGRKMVVVTRQIDYSPDAAQIAHSLGEALELARAASDDEAFVIGGGEIYRQSLDVVNRMYITHVDAEVAGDTHFPAVDWSAWQLVEEICHPADGKNAFKHRFCEYSRKKTAPLLK
jgi:dihydrofolate reductase